MKRFLFGHWQVELDQEATASAYQNMEYVNQGCSCTSCENYYRAVEHFPEQVSTFLKTIGIDARKPSEVYDCGVFKDGNLLYGGFYHLVGNYITGADAWQPVKKKRFLRKESHTNQAPPLYKIAEGYEVGFTKMVALVPDNFPRPVLQMEISFYVPWVLDVKYPLE